MKSQRLAPLSGIVFVVLVLVGILAVGGSTPDSSDSPAKITSFYVDHHDKQFVAAALVAIGTLFLAIWVGSLRERLRGGGEVWSNVALIGGAAAVAGFLFAVVVHIALADGGNQNFSADAMVALNGLDSNDFFAFALPLGIMLLGAAGGALKTGALPGGSPGWPLCSASRASPRLFFAFLLVGLWVIAASIAMSRSAEPAAQAATT